MVRANTPLKTRRSPFRAAKASTNKNSLLNQVFKPPRSPDKTQHRSPYKFKPLRQSPYNRPVFTPNSKLYTIREESPEPEFSNGNRCDVRNSTADSIFFREFELSDVSDANEGGSSDMDTDFEGWDDETTLVAKFQDSAPQTSERKKLAELANELEAPMKARGATLRQYLAHTIAPAARKVKQVHSTMEQKVDVTFGVGVISFDDACKKIEQLSLRDEESLKRTYADTQRNIREYFKQLKEAYGRREQLWKDLDDTVEKSAAKTLASLSALPAELEDTIATIEKKSKDVLKSTGMDSKARETLLRDLLAEM